MSNIQFGHLAKRPQHQRAAQIIILAGLWYGGVLQRDGATGTTTPVAQAPSATTPVAGTAPAPVPSAAVPNGGQVALETAAPVWLRVRDGERTLYVGTMNPGERFAVPADAQNPLADVGQPDKLKVTLNGSALPMLPASERPMRGLRVGAAAVAARLSGQVAPLADPTATAPGTPTPVTGAPTASVPRTTPARAQPRARSQPRDETARANLEAAGDTPAPAPTTTP